MSRADVVIVGAGAAGLAAAGALRHVGIESVLLEQDPAIGGTWARRYDRLHLHTVRRHSGLPHHPIASDLGRYLSRDEYVAYLQDYARHFDLRIVNGYTVESIHRGRDSRLEWEISSAADSWRARAVILATGHYRIPRWPAVPGRDGFRGKFGHSVAYRNASAYVGKRVLVVGAGNSGAEIATDLVEHGASFVAISIRTPPPIVPRDPFGRPVQETGRLLSLLPPRLADRIARLTARLVLGDLVRHGLPAADWRPYSDRRVPVIDVGFVRVLKARRVQIRPALASLTATQAVYVDGSAEPFDAIIAATGFTTGLDTLIGSPTVLDAAGEPLAASGETTSEPGLYFIGYTHSLRGHLFEANLASRKLAANVKRYLA